jgi:Mce-associated membrane protein
VPVKRPRVKLAAYRTPGGAGVQQPISSNHTDNDIVGRPDIQDKPSEHPGEDSDTELADWTLSLSLLPDSATYATGQPPEPPHATGDESHPGTIATSPLADANTVETEDTSNSGASDTGASDTAHTDSAVVRVRRWLASRRGTIVVAALALLTVSLVGLGGICIAQVGQDHDLDIMRTSAIAAAERQTMNLMNVNSANVGAQLDAIRNGTTGDFQRQLVGVLDTFSKVIQQGKIDSTATVTKAGITSMTSDTAKVLLAVSGAVGNAESPQPQSRRYRIGVDLKYSDNHWLVSGMEFIP